MFSNLSCGATLALLSALPMAATGDEPSGAKPTDAPPPAAKPTEQPKPRLFVVPAPQAGTGRRDLLYRGEKAGPYHAIYLRGVPPGVRITGVTPPPLISEPQTRLVAPKGKASAPRIIIVNQGEKK